MVEPTGFAPALPGFQSDVLLLNYDPIASTMPAEHTEKPLLAEEFL